MYPSMQGLCYFVIGRGSAQCLVLMEVQQSIVPVGYCSWELWTGTWTVSSSTISSWNSVVFIFPFRSLQELSPDHSLPSQLRQWSRICQYWMDWLGGIYHWSVMCMLYSCKISTEPCFPPLKEYHLWRWPSLRLECPFQIAHSVTNLDLESHS